ncbi:MAG: RdgB/HAM1 family non-canonical purine NTP pyrophosphatase [Acidobacteriota bacterium]|nr:RdgB/HAM1 family non-canonical purine NTP pyrophosphatase [Acidobacteriota bacterium]MDH3786282.1 RdgB/HAM1 family non-canonical purine NTP pyrophosphatase [Acidobacteriota bacterium]
MIRTLVVATGNLGKVREFQRAFAEVGIEVHGLDALDDTTEVEETGRTFEANARLKAEGYSLRTPDWVVADDSGLEVDALDGAPGVQSARYGGPGLDDDGRNDRLLSALTCRTDPADRTARFVCLLALAKDGVTHSVHRGVVEGRIIDVGESARGENGFGYDPIFFHPPSGCTTAELDPAAKQAISHRGQAIASLLKSLRG